MGTETDTNDYQAPGQVVAEYVYAFERLMVGGVKKVGSEGKCADSIVSKIVNICHTF